MSTPSNSASGNMSPASMTMMSSPQRMAMQFMPNSPSPREAQLEALLASVSFDASTGEHTGFQRAEAPKQWNRLYWREHGTNRKEGLGTASPGRRNPQRLHEGVPDHQGRS